MYPKVLLIEGQVQSSVILCDLCDGWECVQDVREMKTVKMFGLVALLVFLMTSKGLTVLATLDTGGTAVQ